MTGQEAGAEAPAGSAASGWIDPPNIRHSCYDEMPKRLARDDWQRRWRCSCGRIYRVLENPREGYYFAEDRPYMHEGDGHG